MIRQHARGSALAPGVLALLAILVLGGIGSIPGSSMSLRPVPGVSPSTARVPTAATWSATELAARSGSSFSELGRVGPPPSPAPPHRSPSILPSKFSANLSVSPTVVDAKPVLSSSGNYSVIMTAIPNNLLLGPFGYTWSNLPPGCIAADLVQITCSPTTPGTYPIRVLIEDGVGAEANSPEVNLSVYADPVVTIHASNVAGPLPFYTNVMASVTAGVAPFRFLWSWGDAQNMSFGTNPHHQYFLVGGYTINVTVYDSGGGYATSSLDVNVINPLRVGIQVLPDNNSYVDRNLDFNSSILNGSGLFPYTYSWSGLPPGCPQTHHPSLSCVPTAAGHYDVTVEVNDGANEWVNSTVALDIRPLPAQNASFPSSILAEGVVLLAAATAIVFGLSQVPSLSSGGEEAASGYQGPPVAPPSPPMPPLQPAPVSSPPAMAQGPEGPAALAPDSGPAVTAGEFESGGGMAPAEEQSAPSTGDMPTAAPDTSSSEDASPGAGEAWTEGSPASQEPTGSPENPPSSGEGTGSGPTEPPTPPS